MKPIITNYNEETGDFRVVTPVPFTLKDGIEYVDMVVADIPKYEDIKDYNVFDLIRENQELKSQKQEWVDLLDKFKTQQKEFIEWLEVNLEGFKLCDKSFFLTNYKKEIKSYEVILQKYKEVVGVKDE